MSGLLSTPHTQAHQQVYGGESGLNDLKRQARDDQAAALRPVAEQFEALFVNEILKQARKVKLDDGWLDGDKADFYKDWYDKQLSQSISSKGSLGLADKIVEQLAPKLPTVTKSELDQFSQSPPKAASSETPDLLPLTTADSLALRQTK